MLVKCEIFGGRRIRTVEEDGPKYLNSRDTVLFKKREALYGVDVAMPEYGLVQELP